MRAELLDWLDVMLGGRVAEEFVFGDAALRALARRLIEKEVLDRAELGTVLKESAISNDQR